MLEKAIRRLWPFDEPPERWVAIVGVSALSVIAVAGFALAIYAAWLFHDMPDAGDQAD